MCLWCYNFPGGIQDKSDSFPGATQILPRAFFALSAAHIQQTTSQSKHNPQPASILLWPRYYLLPPQTILALKYIKPLFLPHRNCSFSRAKECRERKEGREKKCSQIFLFLHKNPLREHHCKKQKRRERGEKDQYLSRTQIFLPLTEHLEITDRQK